MVYDIGRAETFYHVPYWLEEVKKYAKEGVHCLLVGNKSDLRDKKKQRKEVLKKKATVVPGKVSETEESMVTRKSGEQLAEKNGMPFVESTATDWDNINELFVQLAKTLLDKKQTPHEKASDTQERCGIQKARTQESKNVNLVGGDENPQNCGPMCC